MTVNGIPEKYYLCEKGTRVLVVCPDLPYTFSNTCMKPIEILKKWIDCFNASDVAGIVALYADNAVNHQVANAPVVGKEAISRMFADEFATAEMVCIVENSIQHSLKSKEGGLDLH